MVVTQKLKLAYFFSPWGCKVRPERPEPLFVSPVTRDKACLERVVPPTRNFRVCVASENDHGSPLSPSVRRREKCRVSAHWPHVVCYPISERQFCCRLCYEHSCRLNLNTGFHASPDSNARSIQKPSNHSRRTIQNPRISIPQVQIAYLPLSGDWYVVYNLVQVGRDSRS